MSSQISQKYRKIRRHSGDFLQFSNRLTASLWVFTIFVWTFMFIAVNSWLKNYEIKICTFSRMGSWKKLHTNAYINFLIAVYYYYCSFSYFWKIMLHLFENFAYYKEKNCWIFHKLNFSQLSMLCLRKWVQTINRIYIVIWYSERPCWTYSVAWLITNIILWLNLLLPL